MEEYQEEQPIPPTELEIMIAEANARREKWRGFLQETFETLLLAMVLFIIINTLTARVRVDGPSMEPSFYNNNRVIVNRIAYAFWDLQRGDVIVFPAPPNPNEDYIKRVIGLPGDTIQVKNGVVYVNGVALDEPYINAPPVNDFRKTVVPENMVFVMGDNRNISSDSRSWGPLPIDDVVGKAIFIYWPIQKIGVVEHYVFDGVN